MQHVLRRMSQLIAATRMYGSHRVESFHRTDLEHFLPLICSGGRRGNGRCLKHWLLAKPCNNLAMEVWSRCWRRWRLVEPIWYNGKTKVKKKENEKFSLKIHELKTWLKYLSYECSQLGNKMVETKIMTLEHNIDILGVSETWFNTTMTVNQSGLFGFQPPFCHDRKHKRGSGTCIYVKNSIACTQRSDLEPADLKMVVVEVSLPSSSPDKLIRVCCCYCPPSSNLTKFFLRTRPFFNVLCEV